MQNVLMESEAVKATHAQQLRVYAEEAAQQGEVEASVLLIQEADALEEDLCRRAVQWMELRQRERYIWILVKNHPTLTRTMVRVLKAEGEEDLATRVAAEGTRCHE